MKNIIFFAISFFVIFSCRETVTQKDTMPLQEASPESVGMSTERLSRIDTMLNKAINDSEIPGAVVLVARNGKLVYHKAFGIADSEIGMPYRTEDIFRIASQTKAITSTAVMMLWEEGKFRLDDPISKYIPEFESAQIIESFNEMDSSFTGKPLDKPITIRHLLTHTSGIGYGFIDSDLRFKKVFQKAGIIDAFTTDSITTEDNIKALARMPLHHNPGERFTYSEGLDVLGYFVEIMSGMPFDDYLESKIFKPLGMKDTYFYLPESKYERLVPVLIKDGENWKHYQAVGYDVNYPIKGAKTLFSGGAGLSSTVKDYALFLQMYLNQGELGGKRLLSRTTVQTIMANQIGDIWGENAGGYYGLAFRVIDKIGQDRGGQGSQGTFDFGGYFNTSYFADPKEGIIGIIYKQTQNLPVDNTSWKFRQLVFQAIAD
ncbi:CubicO group peptidase (beta-lactamase class C family) [Flavobacteriaceae bacterium MAR_2010_72]|nr:CubicO group peptidase (beta-lactamase class C family) [Flavobacteriaceae bacterium MAR_2010_72]